MENTENKIEVTEEVVSTDALEQVELQEVEGGIIGWGWIPFFSAEVTGRSCNPFY
jgi:hypothetical protein